MRLNFYAIASFLLISAAAAQSASALIIIPTFDSSINSDPNAAAMETAINAAITQEQNYILSPVTVGIVFQSVASGIGSNNTLFTNLPYRRYRSDLLTHQILSANDMTALATLPNTSDNPVNQEPFVYLTFPLLRAIGESAEADNSFFGGIDSTISLNTSMMNILRTGPQDPEKYDMEQVALHEIQDVLGTGGAGSTLNNPDAGGLVGSLDLYRFSASGTRSFDAGDLSAYFSIDGGATNLSFFNQNADGDYGDWIGTPGNPTLQVQDAFTQRGTQLDLDAVEKLSTDIVGWNVTPTAVPEPASLALLAVSSAGLLSRRRRNI